MKSSLRVRSRFAAPPTFISASRSTSRSAWTRHMSVAGSRACTSAVYSTAGLSPPPEQLTRPSVTHQTSMARPSRDVPIRIGVLISEG